MRHFLFKFKTNIALLPIINIGEPTKIVGAPIKNVGRLTRIVGQPIINIGEPTKKVGKIMLNTKTASQNCEAVSFIMLKFILVRFRFLSAKLGFESLFPHLFHLFAFFFGAAKAGF